MSVALKLPKRTRHMNREELLAAKDVVLATRALLDFETLYVRTGRSCFRRQALRALLQLRGAYVRHQAVTAPDRQVTDAGTHTEARAR